MGWLSILEYAKAYEVEGEQREDLFFHVQKLDEAYLEYHRQKSEKQSKAGKSGKKPRRGGR